VRGAVTQPGLSGFLVGLGRSNLKLRIWIPINQDGCGTDLQKSEKLDPDPQ
jgi:hypothetical protein